MTKLIATKSTFKIFEECAAGNFEKTYDYINSNLKEKITTKRAVGILISCSNACAYRKSDITEESLVKLLRYIQPFFRNLFEATEDELFSYITSIYHINKFFVHKNSLEIIIQMEDIIILKLQPTQLPKKSIVVYQNIAAELYNVIVKSTSSSQNSLGTLLEISYLMLKICAKFLDLTTTINLASGCFRKLIYLKIEVQDQVEYYDAIINSLDFSQIQPENEVIFKHLQDFISCILNNIISRHNFEQGVEFLDKAMNQLGKLLKYEEYIHFHQLLRYFLVTKLKDKLSEINKSIESLTKLKKIWDARSYKKEVIQNLLKLLQTMENYYVQCPKEWLIFSEDIQLQIFKFIMEFHLLQISVLKSAPEEVVENIHRSCVLCPRMIISLMNIYLVYNTKADLDYHQNCLDLVETFFQPILLLKRKKYETWKKTWNNLAVVIYNAGTKLYNELNKAAPLYFLMILKYFIKLENIHDTVHLKYSTLRSLFICLEGMYSKLNKDDSIEKFTYISLAVLVCHEDRNYFMAKWITCKHSLNKNENIQQLDLVKAIEFMQGVTLNSSDKIFLLNTELTHYKTRWPSKVCIVNALEKLNKLSDIENMVKTIVTIFIDLNICHNDKIYDIIGKVLELYKKDASTILSKIDLAKLYYIYYKRCHKKIISENLNEIEKAQSVIPLQVESDALDPTELGKKCDIPCLFESLKLEVYGQILEKLQLSLDTLNKLKHEINTDNLEQLQLLELYKLSLAVAHEFKLMCFSVKVVNALELSLKIAQIINDMPCILKSIRLIIEQIGLKEKSILNLVKLADQLIENKNFNRSDHLEECILYYISKSKALLYDNYQASREAFQQAQLLLELNEEINIQTIKSQLFLLNSKFSMLPCHLEMKTHKKSLLMNAFLAVEFIMQETKQNFDDPYKVSMLFKAGEELINLHHCLKSPREVRCYAKEILVLSQQLVLPLQSATILMYLAHSCLRMRDQDESRVKINSMASILTLDKASSGQISSEKLCGSPGLPIESFQMPDTATHEPLCHCYYCDCYEYQMLVLEKMRLSALMNVKEGTFTIAQAFFQGALKLHESYSYKSLKKNGCVPDFLPSYGYILLNYSSLLWQTNFKDKAQNLNKKLLESLETKKWQYMHLYNEGWLQKLGYYAANVISEPVPELEANMENLKISNEDDCSKTPENKQSHVSITVGSSQFLSPPKLRIKKRLPLIFSPTETDNQNKPAINDQSSKIPIFTDSIDKKTRRRIKSTVSEQVEVPKLKVSTSERKTRQKPANIFLEPTVSDSNSSVIPKSLRTRTKLLTEKLKKETESPNNDLENENGNFSAKKKLMKDMFDSDIDQKIGKEAVRKSRKTKK